MDALTQLLASDVRVVTDGGGKVRSALEVIDGADRVAQNGDVINKVGTYPLALMAKEYAVPFYALVQDPRSLATGDDVPIEERPTSELLFFQGEPLIAAPGSHDIAARYPTPPLDDAVQSQIARIIELWQSVLTRYGKGSGFLFSHFTIADAFYAPVATRFETYGIHLPAVAQAYTQRILATPAMREWEETAKAAQASP